MREELVRDYGGVGFDFYEIDRCGRLAPHICRCWWQRWRAEEGIPIVGTSAIITLRHEFAKLRQTCKLQSCKINDGTYARSQLESAICACRESASLIVI